MKLLSLFSGIGAFEKALTNIGIEYELVGFSEIDKWAIESYCAIHDVDKSLNLGDVSKISEEELPKEVDLITYGFPCQDISIAGEQKGIACGTRSGLLYEAERIIKHTKPKYAIAENVKNLVGKRHKEDFNELLKRLEGYGYNNYWQVLNAKDYGVPQNRERVFIVSIRKDVDDGTFKFPKPIKLNHTFYDYLDETGYYLDKKDYDKVKGLGAKYNFGGYVAPKGQTVYNTITASYSKTSGNSMKFYCNGQYRYLTPLECWRLMGFEDEDYWKARRRLEKVFYNGNDRSNSQMYKQAGNSIVVNVLEVIFINLLT